MTHIREINGSYYVCFRAPNGRQTSRACGKGPAGKRVAQQLAKKIESQLTLGTFEDRSKTTWTEFVTLFDERKMSSRRDRSQSTASESLAHFKRLCCPVFVSQITGADIDDYIRFRRRERGKQKDSLVSPATINKELRYIRQALRAAHRWDMLPKVPEFEFLPEESREPEFISPEDFAKLYEAADTAIYPTLKNNVTPGQFWRGLLLFTYMTGWRIGQTLELQWQDIDIEGKSVFSPADRNKGRRDIACALHPIVIPALLPLRATMEARIFPWDMTNKPLSRQLHEICRAAKVSPRRKTNYGFHDLRRGFATANAENLDLFELQRQMQHKSLETTKRYVAMAQRANATADKLAVPPISFPDQDRQAK